MKKYHFSFKLLYRKDCLILPSNHLQMKVIFFITLILTITFRPLLPIIAYTINYDRIISDLCENREKPELLCNGFCYIKKESNKEKSNSLNDKYEKNFIKIYEALIINNDKLLLNYILKYSESIKFEYYKVIVSNGLITKVFHPPICTFI